MNKLNSLLIEGFRRKNMNAILGDEDLVLSKLDWK